MVKRLSDRPGWVNALTEDLAGELVEHLQLRLVQIERDALADHDDLRPGQLRPALIASVQDALRESIDVMGQEAVNAYTAARASGGVTAKTAQGEELGPLLGLSRGGVYAAFGRAR